MSRSSFLVQTHNSNKILKFQWGGLNHLTFLWVRQCTQSFMPSLHITDFGRNFH